MTSLERTKQGKISINEAYTINDIKNNNYKIYSIEEVLDYKVIEVDEKIEFLVSNGVKIPNIYNVKDKVIIKNNNGKLLGIYENKGEFLVTWKNFV
jgi:tRNA U55 pseudouridine synthase TruB